MATIRCGDVELSTIQAIVFDKDGTIADSQTFLRTLAQKRARLIDAQIPGVQDPLLMAFGADGGRLDPAGLMAVGTRRENEIAAAAYVAETGRGWLESQTIVRSAFAEADQVFQRKADHTPVLEAGLHLLKSFFTAGLSIGLLSSDSTANVQEFVQRYDLESYFAVQQGTDGDISKPDPRLLVQMGTALNVPLENILVVGDAPVDVEMARSAGAAGCLGVTWGGAREADLAGATAVIQHWDQLQIMS